MFRRHRHPVLLSLVLTLSALALVSCSSTNPNTDRALISITVAPETADAQNYPNGQVVFTATGVFNTSPLTGPVISGPPYSGQFTVDNPAQTTIATIVATGTSSVTVQCAAGASGTVGVVISAFANNGTSTTVSASGQLTCP
jgi:hypothetical protein